MTMDNYFICIYMVINILGYNFNITPSNEPWLFSPLPLPPPRRPALVPSSFRAPILVLKDTTKFLKLNLITHVN